MLHFNLPALSFDGIFTLVNCQPPCVLTIAFDKTAQSIRSQMLSLPFGHAATVSLRAVPRHNNGLVDWGSVAEGYG